MFRHYLKASFLACRRTPFLTLIKLLVLSLGLTCFLVAYSVVSYWGHAERAFAKADRTYVMTTRIWLSDGTDTGAVPRLDANFYERLKPAFPEFETLARARAGGVVPVAAGDQKMRLPGAYADAAFLEVFDLPFLAGDPRKALSLPNSAVLTDAAARRLFGTDAAIGRTFRYAGVVDLTVTGVIGAIPQPSHLGPSNSALLRFDVLASWDTLDRVAAARSAAGSNPNPPFPQLGYVVLREGDRSTPASLAPRLAPIGELDIERDLVRFMIGMMPIREITAKQVDSALFAGTNVSVSVSTLLLLLGTMVLGVACVNYVNLAMAQALRRAKEVGLRKAIGANSRQIAAQHLTEAAILTGASLLLAVVLTRTVIRAVAEVDIALVFSDAHFWVYVFAGVALATLLAGAYPAFVLSRVRPFRALQSRDASSSRSTISTLLVSIQFAAASFLLIVIFVMQQQAGELRRANLATTIDPLIVIANTKAFTGVDSASFAEELRALPSVKAVGGMSVPPWSSGDPNRITLMTDFRVPSSLKTAVMTGVDYGFFRTMDMRLVAGRMFDPSRADRSMFQFDLNTPASLVVDEAFVHQIGLAEPRSAIDKIVYLPVSADFQPVRIIGVIEDRPLLFAGGSTVSNVYYLGERPEQILIRIAKDDVAGALQSVQRAWERRAPDHAFEYEFEDQLFARGYAVFSQVTDAFARLTGPAYVICIIGLVGMAGHVTGRRRHEIGVRKTVGASWQSVLRLLVAALSKPVVVANLVAWPFAYLAAQAYLAIFIHRMSLTPLPFVTSLAVSVLVTWATVTAQAWRAARIEPAVILRHE